MIPLYSGKRAEKLLARNKAWISAVCARFGLPDACVEAILYQEMTGMDLLDLAADIAVSLRWRFSLLFGKSARLPGKQDSSTGWGQVYGYVGVSAVNFGREKGVFSPADWGLPSRPMDPKNPEDVHAVWTRLRGNRRFNMAVCALNLLLSAQEMTGRTDMDQFGEEALQLTFTRYNANTRRITAYGRAAYERYLFFLRKERDAGAAYSA